MESLKDADEYVTFDHATGTIRVDHPAMIADLTGTDPAEWNDAEGPDSRVGNDFYWQHEDGLRNARVNVDQSWVSITIADEEGEILSEGSLELSDSDLWCENSDPDEDDRDDDEHDEDDDPY